MATRTLTHARAPTLRTAVETRAKTSGAQRRSAPALATQPRRAKATPAPDGLDSAAPEPSAAKRKLVRDSFRFLEDEYAALDALKKRAAQLARPTKKNELVRAGIALLGSLKDTAFLQALEALPSTKKQRPSNATRGDGSAKPRKA